MGGAGLAIIFVCALVGCALSSLLLVLTLGHYSLHVLGEASAGSTRVREPDETLLDAWHKPVLAVALLGFWAVTGGFTIGPFFVRSFEAFAVFLPTFLWLVYPLSLLCVLGGPHWFAALYFPVLGRLARHAGAVLLVYLMTLPLGAAAVCLYAAAVVYGSAWWVVAAALALPLAALVYARAWGRLAWLALNARGRADKEKGRSVALAVEDPWGPPPEPEAPELDVEVLPAEAPEAPPPPAPADEEEDEWSPYKKPYGVAEDKPWPEAPEAEAPAGEGYDVARDDPPRRPGVTETYEGMAEDERRRRAILAGQAPGSEGYETKRPTLRRALGARLWTGLLSGAALGMWLRLAVLALGQLVLLRLMLSTWPRDL